MPHHSRIGMPAARFARIDSQQAALQDWPFAAKSHRNEYPSERPMFTSEPSLAQRIERMIGDTPIVDPHTHIRCDQPNAPDLAALMGYHWVQTELRAVGMPPEDLDAALPPDERVRRSI